MRLGQGGPIFESLPTACSWSSEPATAVLIVATACVGVERSLTCARSSIARLSLPASCTASLFFGSSCMSWRASLKPSLNLPAISWASARR